MVEKLEITPHDAKVPSLGKFPKGEYCQSQKVYGIFPKLQFLQEICHNVANFLQKLPHVFPPTKTFAFKL